MRLLGVDTSLESQPAAGQKQEFSTLIDTAKSDNRIILTTSKSLVQRNNISEAFLVKASSLNHLEQSLVEIINIYGVNIDKSSLLSVCGKCGGSIIRADLDDPRFDNVGVPRDGRPLYLCSKCSQHYYFNDNPNSSPAQAMKKAEHLYKRIMERSLKATSKEDNDNDDEEEISTSPIPLSPSILESEIDSETETKRLTALFKARDDAYLEKQARINGNPEKYQNLDNEVIISEIGNLDIKKHDDEEQNNDDSNILKFKSVFELFNGNENLYTNINQGFKGCLDYIMVSARDFNVKSAKLINTLEACNSRDLEGLDREFPDSDFPSDHFLLLTEIDFR